MLTALEALKLAPSRVLGGSALCFCQGASPEWISMSKLYGEPWNLAPAVQGQGQVKGETLRLGLATSVSPAASLLANGS